MKLFLSAVLVAVLAIVLLAAIASDGICVVTPDELAVRDAPKGNVIGSLHSGDVPTVTGNYQRDTFPGMGVWMEVEDGDLTGWVDQRYCPKPGLRSLPRGTRK